jgi:lysophospholipase L1-like esterase
MVVKKLLLTSILLTLTQCLRWAALAEGLISSSGERPQATVSGALPTNSGGSNASLRDRSVFPPSDSPPLHNQLLAQLALPLPPLILPDLLLPAYDFPSFNSQRLDQELQIYSRYLRTVGKPDVLIIGSSRSLQGVDPTAMRDALAKKGYPNLKIFNFGINGATAKVINLVLQHILTPDQLPQLIIWADGARAFNEGRPDPTYDHIVASAGFKRVQQGERPIPPRMEWQALAIKAVADKLTNRSSASSLHQPIAPDLDATGFQTVSEQYDPDTYYQRYPWVPGEYDGDYTDFHLSGEQAAATISAATFARNHNLTLVLVNLPLTADYIKGIRGSYERQFRQHMQQLAAQQHFIFCDLSQYPTLMQNRYFADPSHINRYGAQAIAIQLAAHPAIPWHMLQPVASETNLFKQFVSDLGLRTED